MLAKLVILVFLSILFAVRLNWTAQISSVKIITNKRLQLLFFNY